MKKSLGTFEIRRTLARIVQQFSAKGERFVFKGRFGAPPVAVPVELNDRRKRGRDSLYEKLERAQLQAHLSPAEADALAREAVRAARSDYLR